MQFDHFLHYFQVDAISSSIFCEDVIRYSQQGSIRDSSDEEVRVLYFTHFCLVF
jgi:hypothetical protein